MPHWLGSRVAVRVKKLHARPTVGRTVRDSLLDCRSIAFRESRIGHRWLGCSSCKVAITDATGGVCFRSQSGEPEMKRVASAEQKRLQEAGNQQVPWRKWGPYLSERQWGTVREDYSENGDAWGYVSHDAARSRAYHWGEDGLAGFCDDNQRLCFALALWNERDPILKERLFGLTNGQGNHGEDVKEYYFYLDATPTNSYLKWLYKYPQKEFPYQRLIDVNGARSRSEFEYELLDTGIFDRNEYFDVRVEYAKVGPEDILIQIEIENCGDEQADLHVLPTLWFRNTWAWWPNEPRPGLRLETSPRGLPVIAAKHHQLGDRWLYIDRDVRCLFTENETNTQRLENAPNTTPYVKDAFHEYVIGKRQDSVNPAGVGTKAAPHHRLQIPAHGSATLRLRLSDRAPREIDDAFCDFDRVMAERRGDADEFYTDLTPANAGKDEASVFRQALSGMLWSKQFYFYDLGKWLTEHGIDALTPQRIIRNASWGHMYHADVISMPDKWEYPWYAAWDLAFHAMALSTVDLEFAKNQLELITRARYIHPSSQTPAYEWNFGDVNPPVHAWATIFLHRVGQSLHGVEDIDFLKRSFVQLDANFAWWTNRKDRTGRGLFEGGFLGLDNIGVFDRSAPLPTGGYLEQADGTAWMALFAQNMLEIAVEIAAHDRVFDEIATKYVEHFLQIANAMNTVGTSGMWDEDDGFYYDVLRLPDGSSCRLKVRSLVGLLPMCATTVIEPWQRDSVPTVMSYAQDRVQRSPALRQGIHPTGPGNLGKQGRGIMAVVNRDRLHRILGRMLDESEFLSSYGIRSISRVHGDNPYTYWVQGAGYGVKYLPAESDTGMFGGNSNWRGPIWFPLNVMIIRALIQFHCYYGDDFQIECPTGSGRFMNLYEVAKELSTRLTSIFLRGADGNRPVYGGMDKFQHDPRWRDLVLFHEYFHGDNGAGLGASHQTGWTGTVALLMQYFSKVTAADLVAAPTTASRKKFGLSHASSGNY
jgi:hypothetical protein